MATGFRRRLLLLSLVAAADMLYPARPALAEESNSLKGGATAIQFLTFSGGSRRPLTTSGLYLKHHLGVQNALRVGVDFTLDESSAKSDPSDTVSRVDNERFYAFSVSGEFVRYVEPTGPVTIFIGVGPYWAKSRSYSERWTTYPPEGGNPSLIFYDKYEHRSWEIGGSASVGFEWFFKRKLSVLGRVGASFGFGERHDGNEYHSSVYPDSRSESLHATTATAGTSSAALGFSAYF